MNYILTCVLFTIFVILHYIIYRQAKMIDNYVALGNKCIRDNPEKFLEAMAKYGHWNVTKEVSEGDILYQIIDGKKCIIKQGEIK